MLALLLLGLILHPVISGLSELHAAEHAVVLGADADCHGRAHACAHTHDGPHTHGRADARSGDPLDAGGLASDRDAERAHGLAHDLAPGVPGEDAPQGDHTSGAHGLMHQSCGPTALELTGEIRVPPVARLSDPPPDRARAGRPNHPPSTLFRPPIA